jgi:dipeptidyl-peptidase-4
MDKKGRWSFDKVLEDNSRAQQEWESYGLKKEMVKCKSGDLELDAWIIKPANFDPTKKYPVIDYVYGEPASATVQNHWESSLFWHHLASLGYVVVSIENRGAAAPRGREWRKCIYGEVGVAASQDQAQGIMDLCRQFPWLDSTRLGITGWSGGGAQTLNSMFRYPDVFKTGVAIAFVSDQRLYDTIYQERYMNTPQNNPDGYFRGSPISYAEGLKGNLLLLHGTGDDNVHYQNTEVLVNRLVWLGKTFYQVSYPMRTHGISEGRGTSQHVRRTLIDFFKKNL